jgi:hypothetical protein
MELLKTMLTPCDGDERAVIADRVQKSGSKKANRDAEGFKLGAFRNQMQGTTSDIVFWNFMMLREHLSCKGEDREETRLSYQTVNKRVTRQLQLMLPELYSDKPSSKAVSLQPRHIGEAYYAAKYKPDTVTPHLCRMHMMIAVWVNTMSDSTM